MILNQEILVSLKESESEFKLPTLMFSLRCSTIIIVIIFDATDLIHNKIIFLIRHLNKKHATKDTTKIALIFNIIRIWFNLEQVFLGTYGKYRRCIRFTYKDGCVLDPDVFELAFLCLITTFPK